VNLVHRDDIAAACMRLLNHDRSGVLNVSDGRPIRRRELYDGLIAARRLAPIEWVEPSGPPDLGKRVSNRRISKEFDMSFRDAAAAALGGT
jgi:nucleoside-diphosphate-sugar epimerase